MIVKTDVIVCSHQRELMISLVQLFLNEKMILLLRLYKDQIPKETLEALNHLPIEVRSRVIQYKLEEKSIGFFHLKSLILNNCKDLFFSFLVAFRKKGNKSAVFFDATIPAKVLSMFGTVDLLEHGAVNYIERSLEDRSSESYGRSRRIKNVYLLNPDKCPPSLRQKVKKHDFVYHYKSLTTINREYILKVFGVTSKLDFNLLSGKTILITQPLSEDGIVSESFKLALYSALISDNHIIKPHPREVTDYNKHFTCTILKKNIPMELIFLLGHESSSYETIYSTSILSQDCTGNKRAHGVDFNGGLYASIKKNKPQDKSFTRKFFDENFR